jgi:hypothetical protein
VVIVAFTVVLFFPGGGGGGGTTVAVANNVLGLDDSCFLIGTSGALSVSSVLTMSFGGGTDSVGSKYPKSASSGSASSSSSPSVGWVGSNGFSS